jgi:hypothetical protein
LEKSPEKVVPSDEPMVPPAKRRIIRCLTAPNIAVEPRNPDNAPTLYTKRPVGSSGAEGTTLRAVLYDLKHIVG